MAKKTLALLAKKRSELGKKVEQIRDDGFVPAVVYGGDAANEYIALAYNEFEKVYRDAGESSLVVLTIDAGAPVKTLIHEVQYSPLTNRIIHVDFFRVTMTEKLTTDVEIAFVGESKAVKELGAILVKNISEVEVRCFPDDLVSEITVDVSSLSNLEDSIKISDIQLPKGIEILHHEEDDIVVIATPPVTEEELAKLDAQSTPQPAEVPTVEDKGKKSSAE